MLTSWSEQLTPATLSIASVLIATAAVLRAALERVLDPAPLGEPQVPALTDHSAAQLGAVDADRVVGLVPDVGVALSPALT